MRGQPASLTGGRLLRFDRVQRAAHWANAVLFGVLIATALPLYFASVERLVGRHVLVVQVHLWAGVALPVPLLVSLAGPWGAGMRRDLRRINHWGSAEVHRLRSLGRRRDPQADKFNPGQKLNAIFVGGSIAVMLGTGAILEWFGLFPVGWRTGATFVHEVLAFAIVVAVVGHVAMAVTHPETLRAMVGGSISERWAAQHAPGWLAEVRRTAAGQRPARAGRGATATAPAGERGRQGRAGSGGFRRAGRAGWGRPRSPDP